MRQTEPRRRARRGSVLGGVAVAASVICLALSLTAVGAVPAWADPPAPASLCPGADGSVLGPNVCVFNASMSQATIQADLNAIAAQQVPNQFGSQRYAVLFEPGTYGTSANPLNFQFGYYNGEFWAVSQAAPMRRVIVNGFMTLMDYCTAPSFASGGFIADSEMTGSTVVNGSQQQFLVRDRKST